MSCSAAYQIIDQTNDFIIVNKLDRKDFHDSDHEMGLFNLVKTDLNFAQLYPVHRLDKVTTGLLIMAKTLEATQHFQTLFEQNKVGKLYLALSDKKPKKKQGLISGDMAKARRGAWKLLRSHDNPATTQFYSYSPEPGLRLFLLKPHTGRTHQLRVALNSLGSPIIGDDLYKGSPNESTHLHAFALQFELNGTSYSYLCSPKAGKWTQASVTSFITGHFDKPFDLPWPKITK